MKEVYRAKKTVKRYDDVLCESIVYIVKIGKQITDSDGDLLVLPRQNFNKQGKFWNNFYVGTKNKCTKYYKILERIS